MSNMQRAVARGPHADDPSTVDASNNTAGQDGDFRRTTQPTANESISHPHNQSHLDQQVLDSLLGLASANPDGAGFIGAHQPPWSGPGAPESGTAYPGLLAETSDQLWTGNIATSSAVSHEATAAWLVHDVCEDPARALTDLHWPLPGVVTQSSDSIDWSSQATGPINQQDFREARRSLPRRRSRYRFAYSDNRPISIPIAASTSSQEEADPLQRWKDSPPQDEPNPMTSIYGVVRSNQTQLEFQAPEDRPGSIYSQATSGTSADSGNSSSVQSASSAWSAASDASRGRRAGFGPLSRTRQTRVGKRRMGAGVARDSRPFKCTFCCDSFKTKYDWARHEKSRHLNLESWVCAPQGGSVLSPVTGRNHCVYCSIMEPSDEHLEEHNHSTCHDRPLEARSFGRKDHLVQHLRVMHKLQRLPRFDDWKVNAAEITSRCGFCDMELTTWGKRVDHLATHFRKGATMKEWKGEHGFSPAVVEQVVHALPPYLIGSESLSVVPFSATKQGTKDHYAQISSRTHGYQRQEAQGVPEEKKASPVQSPALLNSRAATSKAFTDILERHLKHFADEHMARGVVPTDDMLKQESRRVIYDSDDEWNQTVADNSDWLAHFRRRYGLDSLHVTGDNNPQPG